MIATARAILKPCSPPGSPQPSIRSLMSAGSSWGTLASAAVTICWTASSGRVVVSDPLNARPMGDLAVATITASGMAAPSDSLGLLVGSLCQRPASANCSRPASWSWQQGALPEAGQVPRAWDSVCAAGVAGTAPSRDTAPRYGGMGAAGTTTRLVLTGGGW